MKHFLRRAGASTLAATLGAGLALSSPGSAIAAVSSDAAPVAGSAAWLESQLTDGLAFNPNFGGFDDYGLSIDIALGLDAVGGHDATVQQVTDAIAANLSSYTSYPTGNSTHVLAGSLGKALALATSAGRDGTTFGGTDLVADLEAQVATTPPIAGRIQDTFDPTQQFEADFSNTIGQALAVQGLDAAGSPLVAPTTGFLLSQQCSDGFFRLNFAAADAPLQACDADPAASPDTDVTALAVLALQSQTDDAAVQAAVTRASSWLADAQRADGSFGGGTATEQPNANSTGLAASALGLSGDTTAASAAARWLADRQLTALPCSTSPAGSDTGAVAYDEAAQTEADLKGVTKDTADQFRRATAQALPGLLWLDAAPITAPLTMSGPSGFRAAGSKVRFTVSGLAEGEKACVGATLVTGPATSAVVKLPTTTTTRTFRALRLGAPSTAVTVTSLRATKLALSLTRAVVKRRGSTTVRINGLAPRESVRVFLRGRPVASGKATIKGFFGRTFRVGAKVGRANVKVVGHFANRTNVKSIRVIR